MREVDYIVLGQGLAGSLLALELQSAGKKVMLIDQPKAGAASHVASGMWNPITFRLVLKSWRVDELLPFALSYYHQLGEILGGNWLKTLEISRAFPDTAYAESWEEKCEMPDLKAYLANSQAPHPALRYPGGEGRVKMAGWLQTTALLNAIGKQLSAKDALLSLDFDYDKLQINKDGVQYEGIKAQNMVFCEGSFVSNNPWFNYLPLKVAQGDVLTLEVPGLKLNQIYNAGFFILPLGGDLYRVGATYEWDVLSKTPTEKGKNYLLEKFTQACSLPYKLVDHQSGIRPTVADRRPLLGRHPKYPQLAIFNGLGTKGVMLAPWFAHQMAAHLLHGESIEAEVSIERFRKRFLKSQ